MWPDMHKAKENQRQETSKAKGGVELLIEHSKPEGGNGK
jgi:hypothetical protein